MEYSVNIPSLTIIMSFVKFDLWTPRMELNSFTTKPPHLLCESFCVYFILTILYLNITQSLKFDDSYLIDKLSKWKNKKLTHKFPSIMYTNYYIYVKMWIHFKKKIFQWPFFGKTKFKHIICKWKNLCE